MTVTFVQEMELAGMVDESGVLARSPLPSETPLLPSSVELRDGRLLWSRPRFGMPTDLRARIKGGTTEGMLDSFVKLRDGTDALRFAETHGVLGLCEHGLPSEHNPPPLEVDLKSLSPSTWCRPQGWHEDSPWEPIDRWLYFSRQARAILQIAAALHREEPPSEEDWLTVYAGRPELKGATRKLAESGSRDEHQSHIEDAINKWLALGNVRPRFHWGRERAPSLRLGASTFGVLAIQLMSAVIRARDIYTCSGCGSPYFREGRKPKPGQRNFCGADDCKRVAARIRQQEHRTAAPDKRPVKRGKEKAQ